MQRIIQLFFTARQRVARRLYDLGLLELCRRVMPKVQGGSSWTPPWHVGAGFTLQAVGVPATFTGQEVNTTQTLTFADILYIRETESALFEKNLPTTLGVTRIVGNMTKLPELEIAIASDSTVPRLVGGLPVVINLSLFDPTQNATRTANAYLSSDTPHQAIEPEKELVRVLKFVCTTFWT